MSVLEVDQHWEVARRALENDKGIVVTRDGEVVGHLVPAQFKTMEVPRKRFDPEENRKRRESLMEGLEPFNSTPALMESREDRKLI